jgi:hypothetical protein
LAAARALISRAFLLVIIAILTAPFTGIARAQPVTPDTRPAVISLDVSAPVAGVGQQFEVRLMIDPGGRKVDAAQVRMTYDPTRLQVVRLDGSPATEIVDGPVMDTALFNRVQPGNGQIDYAAGRLFPPEPTELFVLAVIHFRALAPTGSDGTVLRIGDASSGTEVAGGGIAPLNVREARVVIAEGEPPATVTLPALPSPAPTFAVEAPGTPATRVAAPSPAVTNAPAPSPRPVIVSPEVQLPEETADAEPTKPAEPVALVVICRPLGPNQGLPYEPRVVPTTELREELARGAVYPIGALPVPTSVSMTVPPGTRCSEATPVPASQPAPISLESAIPLLVLLVFAAGVAVVWWSRPR